MRWETAEITGRFPNASRRLPRQQVASASPNYPPPQPSPSRGEGADVPRVPDVVVDTPENPVVGDFPRTVPLRRFPPPLRGRDREGGGSETWTSEQRHPERLAPLTLRPGKGLPAPPRATSQPPAGVQRDNAAGERLPLHAAKPGSGDHVRKSL